MIESSFRPMLLFLVAIIICFLSFFSQPVLTLHIKEGFNVVDLTYPLPIEETADQQVVLRHCTVSGLIEVDAVGGGSLRIDNCTIKDIEVKNEHESTNFTLQLVNSRISSSVDVDFRYSFTGDLIIEIMNNTLHDPVLGLARPAAPDQGPRIRLEGKAVCGAGSYVAILKNTIWTTCGAQVIAVREFRLPGVFDDSRQQVLISGNNITARIYSTDAPWYRLIVVFLYSRLSEGGVEEKLGGFSITDNVFNVTMFGVDKHLYLITFGVMNTSNVRLIDLSRNMALLQMLRADGAISSSSSSSTEEFVKPRNVDAVLVRVAMLRSSASSEPLRWYVWANITDLRVVANRLTLLAARSSSIAVYAAYCAAIRLTAREGGVRGWERISISQNVLASGCITGGENGGNDPNINDLHLLEEANSGGSDGSGRGGNFLRTGPKCTPAGAFYTIFFEACKTGNRMPGRQIFLNENSLLASLAPPMTRGFIMQIRAWEFRVEHIEVSGNRMHMVGPPLARKEGFSYTSAAVSAIELSEEDCRGRWVVQFISFSYNRIVLSWIRGGSGIRLEASNSLIYGLAVFENVLDLRLTHRPLELVTTPQLMQYLSTQDFGDLNNLCGLWLHGVYQGGANVTIRENSIMLHATGGFQSIAAVGVQTANAVNMHEFTQYSCFVISNNVTLRSDNWQLWWNAQQIAFFVRKTLAFEHVTDLVMRGNNVDVYGNPSRWETGFGELQGVSFVFWSAGPSPVFENITISENNFIFHREQQQQQQGGSDDSSSSSSSSSATLTSVTFFKLSIVAFTSSTVDKAKPVKDGPPFTFEGDLTSTAKLRAAIVLESNIIVAFASLRVSFVGISLCGTLKVAGGGLLLVARHNVVRGDVTGFSWSDSGGLLEIEPWRSANKVSDAPEQVLVFRCKDLLSEVVVEEQEAPLESGSNSLIESFNNSFFFRGGAIGQLVTLDVTSFSFSGSSTTESPKQSGYALLRALDTLFKVDVSAAMPFNSGMGRFLNQRETQLGRASGLLRLGDSFFSREDNARQLFGRPFVVGSSLFHLKAKSGAVLLERVGSPGAAALSLHVVDQSSIDIIIVSSTTEQTSLVSSPQEEDRKFKLPSASTALTPHPSSSPSKFSFVDSTFSSTATDTGGAKSNVVFLPRLPGFSDIIINKSNISYYTRKQQQQQQKYSSSTWVLTSFEGPFLPRPRTVNGREFSAVSSSIILLHSHMRGDAVPDTSLAAVAACSKDCGEPKGKLLRDTVLLRSTCCSFNELALRKSDTFFDPCRGPLADIATCVRSETRSISRTASRIPRCGLFRLVIIGNNNNEDALRFSSGKSLRLAVALVVQSEAQEEDGRQALQELGQEQSEQFTLFRRNVTFVEGKAAAAAAARSEAIFINLNPEVARVRHIRVSAKRALSVQFQVAATLDSSQRNSFRFAVDPAALACAAMPDLRLVGSKRRHQLFVEVSPSEWWPTVTVVLPGPQDNGAISAGVLRSLARVEAAASAAAFISALAGANPMAAVAMNKLRALRQMALCSYSDTNEPVGVTVNPLGLGFGSERGYYQRGMCVSSVIFLFGCAGLIAAIAYRSFREERMKRQKLQHKTTTAAEAATQPSSLKNHATFGETLSRHMLPGALYIPCFFLLQGVGSSAAALLRHQEDGGSDVFVAIVIGLLPVIFFLTWMWSAFFVQLRRSRLQYFLRGDGSREALAATDVMGDSANNSKVSSSASVVEPGCPFCTGRRSIFRPTKIIEKQQQQQEQQQQDQDTRDVSKRRWALAFVITALNEFVTGAYGDWKMRSSQRKTKLRKQQESREKKSQMLYCQTSIIIDNYSHTGRVVILVEGVVALLTGVLTAFASKAGMNTSSCSYAAAFAIVLNAIPVLMLLVYTGRDNAYRGYAARSFSGIAAVGIALVAVIVALERVGILVGIMFLDKIFSLIVNFAVLVNSFLDLVAVFAGLQLSWLGRALYGFRHATIHRLLRWWLLRSASSGGGDAAAAVVGAEGEEVAILMEQAQQQQPPTVSPGDDDDDPLIMDAFLRPASRSVSVSLNNSAMNNTNSSTSRNRGRKMQRSRHASPTCWETDEHQ